MPGKDLSRLPRLFPSVMEDFFKPWNEWLTPERNTSRQLTVPAVNITETGDSYKVSLAAPGLKKEDFTIDLEGNLLTISAQKEENKEEAEEKYTRKEYNYTSFSRSFTLPEDIRSEAIEARYEEGVLNLMLPKKEEAKKGTTLKHISVK